MQVGIFLQGTAARGATVAPARLRAFRWLREHLGLPFPVASSMLMGFSHAPPTHIPKQARTFSPDEFWSIVGLSLAEGERRGVEAAMTIFASLACIRCAHLGRSSLQEVTSDTLYAHCAEGKRRRLGTRPPYSWAVPRPPFLGPEPFAQIVEVNCQLGSPGFLIPSLADAKGHFPARKWQRKAMPHRQWVAIIRRVASDIGKDSTESAEFTYNSARRFLPTVANVLGFGPDIRQAIGSWEELPGGDGGSGARAVRSMGLHYSADVAAASGRAKRLVLDKFVDMCSEHPAVQEILTGIPTKMPAGSLTWKMLSEQTLRVQPDPVANLAAPVETATGTSSSSRKRRKPPAA